MSELTSLRNIGDEIEKKLKSVVTFYNHSKPERLTRSGLFCLV